MADEDSSFSSARRARSSALAALAAELGHEMQGPINLFRLITDRAALGETLDAEDISLLREELDRLTRQSARLRRLAQLTPRKEAVSPHTVLTRALELEPRRGQLELDVPTSSGLVLECDPTLLGLALAELVDNALAARSGRAGVRFAQRESHGFCVWDDGAGFAMDSSAALAWGATTKPGAAGLGLTLALRVTRAHGFALNVLRTNGRTEVWVDIPAHPLGGGATSLPA